MNLPHTALRPVSALLIAGVLVACSSSDDANDAAPGTEVTPASTVAATTFPIEQADTTPPATLPPTSVAPAVDAAAQPIDLRGVCPDPVVFQADWNPEAEHGGVYNLLGAGYTVDVERQRVTGPLMTGGTATGIDVEIRSGGPAVGFTPAPVLMYRDPSIFFGFIGTDDAIEFSTAAPTVALVAPLEISPMMVMWSPETYPNITTIADLKAAGVPLRYFEGEPYMQYLLNEAIVDPQQLDSSYDGNSTVFVAEQGRIAQQGFASSEPYLYSELVDGWKRPVSYQLVHDAGWQPYAQSLSVRPEVIEPLTPCLEQLVPILQRSQVDFIANPDATVATILDLVQAYDNGWDYSQGMSEYSIRTQLELGLVSNGSSPTLGDLDAARVDALIAIARPILEANGATIPTGLTARDLIDNRFIDPSIALPEASP